MACLHGFCLIYSIFSPPIASRQPVAVNYAEIIDYCGKYRNFVLY